MSFLCRLSLLAVFALSLSRSFASSEARDPYQFRIVIHFERHREFTEVYRQQIKREVGDGIQAALGRAAKVEVTDSHPKLLDIRTQGLARALDRYRERNKFHTFFVLIELSGTDYQIQSRLHDGLTGLPSPVVRKDRTNDRSFVARKTAFLLNRDLGLHGTVISEPDPGRLVKVELKATSFGVDLGRWVSKGEVFQLVRVDGAGPAQPEKWSYLQVVEPPRAGVCTCKLISRYQLARVSGLKAVLLGTRIGPVRLRLLQENPDGGTGPLQAAVNLQFRKHGFESEDPSLQLTATSGREVNTSTYGSRGQFDRLAFVSVLTGETRRAIVPVPVVDDSVNVLVVPATSEEDDLILERLQRLQQRVLEALAVQAQQFRRINDLTAKPEKREEALAAVRQSLKRLGQDHTKLSGECEEVKKEIEKLDVKVRPRAQSLQGIDERLKELKSGETELQQQVALLEKIEKDENDPTKKEARLQIERAKRLEKDAEIGQAIEIYEKLPAELLKDDIKKHLEKLKALWKPKDDDHAKARQFIYQTWPAMQTADLKAGIKEAWTHFAVCEKAKDLLGPSKLRLGLAQHLKRIQQEQGDLNPRVNIDDEKPAQLIKELLPELQKLDQALGRYIEKQKTE
jgi:hypothetical protein